MWILPLAVGASLASGKASARSYRGYGEPVIEKRDFWRDVGTPNFYEVETLRNKATQLFNAVEASLTGDTAFAADERIKYLTDAYHLMKHARSLAPTDLGILGLLGRAADEAGMTAQAIEAWDAHIKIANGLDHADHDVLARYGALQIRLGKIDEAIGLLKYAQGTVTPSGYGAANDPGRAHAMAAIYLAHALSAKGDITAALDTLIAANGSNVAQYYGYGYGSGVTLVAFALAVQYDRNEQRAAAFDQLEKLQAGLAQNGATYFKNQILDDLARIPMSPPEDVHYYRGLMYEASARYVEARAEWATYSAIPDALWRHRALDHIALIDARKRATPEDPNNPVGPGGIPIPTPSP